MNEIEQLQNALMQLQSSTNILTTDQSVERLIGIYEHATSLKSSLDEIRDECKHALTEIIAETGQMDWNTASGRCYVTKPSIIVRYNAKSLDVLIASSPEMYQALSPFRTETERAGTLTIRAAGK